MYLTEAPLSRRDALKGAGVLIISLSIPSGRLWAQAAKAPPTIPPSAFIRIDGEGLVTIVSKHIEFGQGPYTGLATIAADELDADWSKVRVVGAPANPAVYGNLKLGGVMLTGGSSAMANSWEQFRRAGATARAMLVQAAASQWRVKPAEITVSKGVISHAASGKSAGFGQFAAAAAKLPVPNDVTLKQPSAFTLIGKDKATPRVDIAGKVNGSTKFTIDIYEPDMLTVLVARSPRFGGRVASFNAAQALRVKGVVAVKQISNGVAVYATGMWPAIKGRNALTVQWDDTASEQRGSDEMFAEYSKRAASPGITHKAHGNVDAALTGGDVVEAEFHFPYLAHAPMEPLDGFIIWDGKTAKARFGCQAQSLDLGAIAKVFGLTPDKVEIDMLLAGGSFGRRAQTTAHFATELAEVAKAIGPNKPVKLVWTREDDIHGGYYRPLMVHRFRGAVKDGEVVAWANTVAGQSFAKNTPFEARMIKDGKDAMMTEGAEDMLYDIANFRCDAHIDSTPVTSLWWRSVGHTHTGYAVECFLDMLLEKAGKDPVAGRLELLKSQPRAAGVIKAVAEAAGWKGPVVGNGRARGVAMVQSFDTYVAQIAEVSIGENGEPKVHKVWAAVDLGIAINPDIIRAQIEGGIGYAVGHALYAEVPLVKGQPTVSNFNDYRSLRINEMPEVEVVIVNSSEAPTGIGEPGVPPCAPAIANALARLGQKRPARLPMVKPV